MRKFLAGLVLAFLACASPALAQNTQVCNRVATGAVSGVSTTAVISGTTGKQINICGYTINSNSTNPIVQFVVGTGATCTSPAPVAPTWILGAIGDHLTDHVDFGFAASGQGQTLCIVVGGTSPSVLYSVYYIITP